MSRYYRYKNGAEVTVRPDLEARTRYYMRSGFREGEAYRDATYGQVDRAGRVVHIQGKRNGKYFITEDWGFEDWTDDMFAGPANDECYCQSLL